MHWGAGLFGECNNGCRALACTAARRKTGKKAPNSSQASLLPSTLSPRCGVCSEPVSNAFPTSRQSFQGFHAFAQQQQQCFVQTFPLVFWPTQAVLFLGSWGNICPPPGGAEDAQCPWHPLSPSPVTRSWWERVMAHMNSFIPRNASHEV